jgi:hypothetical protein
LSRPQSPAELELAAKALRRDEDARNALRPPGRLVSGAVSLLVVLIIQGLAHVWQELPAHAGVAIAGLAGAVIALAFEVYFARRRVDAIVQLLRLPTDA